MHSRFPRQPLHTLLAAIDSGWSPRCETGPAGPDEWGVLKVSAVTWGTYQPGENKRLPPSLEPRPEAEVAPGDLLLSRANTRELVGRAVLVKETRPKLMMSDKLLRLRVDVGADARFVLAVLSARDMREQIELAASGSSGSMKNISQGKLGSLLVPVPPLPEQRKIAAILSAVDEVIEKSEAVTKSLHTLKKAVMQELLTRGLPGRHTRFKQTEIGEIPDEWEIATLGALCSRMVVGVVVKPASYYVPTGIPALRGKNVRADRLDLDDLVYFSAASNELLSKSKLRAGDVLTVRTGEPGVSCTVPCDLDGANCIDIIVSTPGPRLLPAFMSRYLNGAAGKALVEIGKGGLAQQHFNVGAMKAMPICVPSLAEQSAITAALQAVDDRIHHESMATSAIRALKSALMSVLLTGELRVSANEDGA